MRALYPFAMRADASTRRGRRDPGRRPPARSLAVAAIAVATLATACSDAPGPAAIPEDALTPARGELAAGRWQAALDLCEGLASGPAEGSEACGARYCAFLARTMQLVDELNDFLLPTFRSAEIGIPPGSLERYVAISQLLDRIAADADAVIAAGCSFDLRSLPLRLGDAADPIVLSEVRGRFTTRSAALVGAIADSVRYVFASTIDAAPVPPPPDGSQVPGLPALLERIRVQIALHDRLLRQVPADPRRPQGGWLDRSGDGEIGPGDELLLDLFDPSSDERTFDLSGAEIVAAAAEPLGAITPTADLPPPRCGYERWHVDTLFESRDVGTTDGMSFSPDGASLALPIKVDGRYEVHVAAADGSGPRCLTCDTTAGWDDAVVADNAWSPDGRRIVYRTTPNASPRGPSSIRVLAFDCVQ